MAQILITFVLFLIVSHARHYDGKRIPSHCDRVLYSNNYGKETGVTVLIDAYHSITYEIVPEIGKSDHDVVYQIVSVENTKNSLKSLIITWNVGGETANVVDALEPILNAILTASNNPDLFKQIDVVFLGFQELSAEFAKTMFHPLTSGILTGFENKGIKYIGAQKRRIAAVLFIKRENKKYGYVVSMGPKGHLTGVGKKKKGVITKGYIYHEEPVRSGTLFVRYITGHFPFTGKTPKAYRGALDQRTAMIDETWHVAESWGQGVVFLLGDLNFRIAQKSIAKYISSDIQQNAFKYARRVWWENGAHIDFSANEFADIVNRAAGRGLYEDELTNLMDTRKSKSVNYWSESSYPHFKATCKHKIMKKPPKQKKGGALSVFHGPAASSTKAVGHEEVATGHDDARKEFDDYYVDNYYNKYDDQSQEILQQLLRSKVHSKHKNRH